MKETHGSKPQAHPIAIVACAIASVAGDHPTALHAALASGLSGLERQADHYAVGNEEPSSSPVIAAPMALLGNTLNLHLSELLMRALAPLRTAFEQPERLPSIVILLPLERARCARAKRVDPEGIRANLMESLPWLEGAHMECLPYTQGATAALQVRLQRLEAGEIEGLLFCGADNLINSLTYNQLAGDNRLATESHGDGVVPGAAAGAIHLRRQRDGEGEPLALLEGIGSAEEPRVGEAARQPLEGTHLALTRATGHRPELLQKAGTLIQAHNLGTSGELEWHQVTQRLWPLRLPEQQRVAMMLGEIDAPDVAPSAIPQRVNLNNVIGETGAAALPLQLAMACERFRYDAEMARFGLPAPRPALVCEMNDYPQRGAVALRPPEPSPQAEAPPGKQDKVSQP